MVRQDLPSATAARVAAGTVDCAHPEKQWRLVRSPLGRLRGRRGRTRFRPRANRCAPACREAHHSSAASPTWATLSSRRKPRKWINSALAPPCSSATRSRSGWFRPLSLSMGNSLLISLPSADLDVLHPLRFVLRAVWRQRRPDFHCSCATAPRTCSLFAMTELIVHHMQTVSSSWHPSFSIYVV